MPVEPQYVNPDLQPADPPSVHLFPDYQPSHRGSRHPIRHTLWAGWLAFTLALLLLWAHPDGWPPVYWTLAGLSFGLCLLIKGCLALGPLEGVTTPPPTHRSRAITRLAASRDHWFPMLLFTLQTAFLFLNTAILWVTLPRLGLPMHPLVSIGLFSMLVLVALRRLLAEWARRGHPTVRPAAMDVLQYLTTIVVSLLLALALSHAVSPFGHPITGDTTLPLVFIWVVASFVILVSMVLIVDRISGRKRRPGPRPHGRIKPS
jgi:hypothetical protein